MIKKGVLLVVGLCCVGTTLALVISWATVTQLNGRHMCLAAMKEVIEWVIAVARV